MADLQKGVWRDRSDRSAQAEPRAPEHAHDQREEHDIDELRDAQGSRRHDDTRAVSLIAVRICSRSSALLNSLSAPPPAERRRHAMNPSGRMSTAPSASTPYAADQRFETSSSSPSG